jgi:hypothetical protein
LTTACCWFSVPRIFSVPSITFYPVMLRFLLILFFWQRIHDLCGEYKYWVRKFCVLTTLYPVHNAALKGKIVVNDLGHCKRSCCEEPNLNGLKQDLTQNNWLTDRNLRLGRPEFGAGII